MKKLFKLFFNLILAIVAVFITLVVIFFLNENWQQRAAEEFTELDTQRSWQIGKVYLRPTTLEVNELFILQDGIGAEVSKVRFEGPFWKVFLNNKLQVKSGEINGLYLDLNNIKVTDLISTDYDTFISDARNSEDFWQDRVEEWMSRLKSEGVSMELRSVFVDGKVLFPGDNLVSVSFLIVKADTDSPSGSVVERVNFEGDTGELSL